MIRSFNIARLASVAAFVLAAGPLTAHAQSITEDVRLPISEPNARAGLAMAMNDSYIAVGGEQANKVFLFDRTSLELIRVYDAPVANRNFGASVALHGDVLVIGAPASLGGGNVGIVYVHNIATDQFIGSITPPGMAAGTNFGRSVAVHADKVLIGAPGDSATAQNMGAAFLYRNYTQLVATITDPEGIAGDELGGSAGGGVAIGEQFALVGARSADRDGLLSSGTAFVLDANTGQILRRLAPSDPLPLAQFGISVDLDGSVGVVGAHIHNEPLFRAGAAYIFDLATGQQLHKLTPNDPNTNEQFGLSVSISGDLVLVGGQNDNNNGIIAGSAQLFRVSDAQFLAELVASDAAPNEWFARTVDIDGPTALIGAPYSNDGASQSGAVYVYRAAAARITQQPESLVADANAPATMSVAVNDDANVGFQWRLNGQPIADGPDFQGVDTPVLNIMAKDSTEGYYDCVITLDPLPPVISDRAVLAVLPNPDICVPDVNNDGLINFFDISLFIQLFNAGCP